MRVLHVSTFESSGGAARAAHGLHVGLVAEGVDSHMLVRERQSDDPRVCVATPNEVDVGVWREIALHWIHNNRTALSNTFFSTGFAGIAAADHPLVRSADVINLHWIPGLIDPRGIGELLALGKPVVWTVHDEWAYSGGCHYASGCEQWRHSCRECPQLASDPHGLVSAIFQEKLTQYARGPLTVVAPSVWLAERVRASALLRGSQVEVIPYGVDLDVFTPARRDEGRARLGVQPDEAVILFSADAAGERRKGFEELCAALELVRAQLNALGSLASPVRLVVLGNVDRVQLPEGTLATGRLFSRTELASVVAGSDLYVLPSLEDNLPNGVLEALACGTACAAFTVGGVPDMLAHAPISYLAPMGDVAALAGAMVRAVHDLPTLRTRRADLREHALKHYALSHQARSYMKLYSALLAESLTAA